VTAASARLGTPPADDRLAAACDDLPALAALPVLVPPTAVPGALERAFLIAESADLRVVRLCPCTHGYPLAGWALSPLPELCADAGLAIMIDFAPGPASWQDVVKLARQHPSLPLIVTGAREPTSYVVPAVMDATANVVIDIGAYANDGEIAGLVTMFGPHRYVWGSGGRTPAASPPADVEGVTADDLDAVLAANAGSLANGTYRQAWL
jgi:hypothetical protein